PKVKGQVAPDYRYEASDTLTAKDLCYRAVMEDDAEAQYLVGISFKTKALILKEQEQQQDQEFVTSAEATANPEPSGVLPLTSHISAADSFARAAYWFALAAPKHMEALHEHGVALIHGYQGMPEVAKGEQLIATAAEAGVVNAMALLGYFYLVGSESFRPDSQLALQYLQRAAEGEQTEAMANLGVLYYQQKNLAQAYHFISKAAQAGYPHAQYHLALMLANGDGCTRDMIASEYWMAEAAEQGQLDAMLTRAQHMLNDDNAFGSDLTQAEDYLRQVIKYGHSVPAMIELSMALADGMLGRIDVVGAAALLKLARQHANKKEAEIIEPLWRSLALQIENVLKVTQDPAEIHSLKRAQTLLVI
ncbi:MAG: sel1 repeat family protein, partial [Shewanella sp.]|nr:sel1 repeat family protein [Shewanella sp.]